MVDKPIFNPGVSPSSRPERPETPTEKPGIPADETGQPRHFALPSEGAPGVEAAKPGEGPTPMEAAGEAAKQKPPVTMEQLHGNAENLSNQFGAIRDKLKNPDITSKFTKDHHEALEKVTSRLGQDMRALAKHTGEDFTVQKKSGEGAIEYALNFLGGAEGTMKNVLHHLATTPDMGFGQQMAMQMVMQRATQKTELVVSIIGAGTSGIKTIMSTQLG